MRLREIDFLRGVAVLLVMHSHFGLVAWIAKGGWVGVDLFFVLSGFLVSGLLFSEYKKRGRVDAWSFLVRRGFKIYPLFYLLAFLTIAGFWGSGKYSNRQIFSELFFVQNFFGGLWPHTWSLAVEEHFYFGIAIMAAILARRGLMGEAKVVVGGIVGGLVVVFCVRVGQFFLIPYKYNHHFAATYVRADSLLFGVLLAYFHHFQRGSFGRFFQGRRGLLYLLAVGLIAPAFIWERESFIVSGIGFTLFYLGFGIVLGNFVTDAGINGKLDRFLTRGAADAISRIGFFSYGIYLLHFPVLDLVAIPMLNAGYRRPVAFVIYALSSVLGGAGISKGIEMPMLRVRDRFFPRGTGRTSAPVAAVQKA